MPEPESLSTVFHNSFVSLGGDDFGLRVAPGIEPGEFAFPVEGLPLRMNSVTDTRAAFEPAAGTLLAFLPASELPDGYYSLRATWGNLKIAGGGEPTFTDITNFGFYANDFLVDDLVSLNGVASTIVGYFNFGGFDISIRTKVASTANICYMGFLLATKIAPPGVIIPPP